MRVAESKSIKDENEAGDGPGVIKLNEEQITAKEKTHKHLEPNLVSNAVTFKDITNGGTRAVLSNRKLTHQ